MSHEHFQERLDLVKAIIVGFDLEPTDILPVDYDENSPFQYNNFIYKITLANSATARNFANGGPYTIPPPAGGVSTFIMRLSNPKAEGIVQDNRIENEVAAIHLARQGLLAFRPEVAFLIPAVYAWRSHKSAKGGFGWTLMEFKEGIPLDRKFRDLPDEDKKNILEQIADVFSGIQRAPLPDSIQSHGGLTIDDAGKIVGGEMTTLKGGPWASYLDFWKSKLAYQLEDSGESPVLEGWKPNGVEERISRFISSGLDQYFASTGLDTAKRVLIHGDLTTNNIQYQPETNKLTGILDFDFAYVSHPCHEFFASLGDIGGNTGGGTGRDPDLSGGRLGKAMITGNFDIPDLPEEATGQLRTAKAWDDALAARGTMRPSDIPQMPALDQLRKLEGLLCPFALLHPMVLRGQTPEQITEMRKAAEKDLTDCLESFGY
ncbi:phosphotransferase enzyme family protein [Colletotrichum truncatum]|uniref:Phosphotransferase enzyme family protein n=1 Tax=Colletotrichum truncatum TaxID=5467 RepID=A0ACC3YNA1_COLTU|nr:phosphotransferase enzyme family protein [Colletotrichum truncatum]KAF6789553.1 phosphotransferase enzyme family protein [Colletotrichum truncatum]